MNGPEILAPAGSPEALEAALCCGADAVYLGVDAFNARRGASNFTLDALPETVARCHRQGTKVYLTLNILLLEEELEPFARVLEGACAAGIDAAIVQDLGAVRLLRRLAPGLRLHASTQMSVHNAEGARALGDMGFARVVAARECTGEELARMVREGGIEVEAFVHGALCMCVSGQCYLSSLLGRRSGNRGLCAQPCRLPFESGRMSHGLSLKDMSLVEHLGELREMGISSFKIEGRMKRPEYVAAAVTACRRALAGEPADLDCLRSVFSRSGFTDGYFTGRRDGAMFGKREKEDVEAAAAVLDGLSLLYRDPRRRVQPVDCRFSFSMKAGEPTLLEARDGEGRLASVPGEIPGEAQNRPTDEEQVRAALSKTGGTPYAVRGITAQISPRLRLSASALNAMRRRALEELDALRMAPAPVAFGGMEGLFPSLPPRRAEGPPGLRVRCYHREQVTPGLLEESELCTLPVPELLLLLRERPEICREKLCAGLPRVIFEGQARLRGELRQLAQAGISHASAGNLGALRLLIESGLPFIRHGETYLNLINSQAVKEAEPLICDTLLSPEMTLAAAKRMPCPIPRGLLVYGHLALMLLRNCPVRASAGCESCRKGENGLTDRMGETFRTVCGYGCSELMNPRPLYMADRLEELGGLDFVTLQFVWEPAAQCLRILRAYRTGEDEAPPESFTRGLLYKTIL